MAFLVVSILTKALTRPLPDGVAGSETQEETTT